MLKQESLKTNLMSNFKNHVIKTLSYLPFKYGFQPFYSGEGTILLMHKIVAKKADSRRIELMEANEVDTIFLEKMIVHLKKTYDIISLDDVHKRLEYSKKNKRKFIAITFDDGYKDNLNLAYPIFKKHNVPFTIYVTNSFPNLTAKLWWYMLEDIVLENPEIIFLYKEKKYRFKAVSKTEKNKSFIAIRELLIDASKNELSHILKQLEYTYNKNLANYIKAEALNWGEITKLAKDKLVTIGCHTVNHLSLKTLSEKEITEEVIKSKDELEQKTEIEINHFAYPYGTFNEIGEREINILDRINVFKTSTTTRTGNIFPQHTNFKNSLPRIQVLGTQQDILILNMYLSGFLPALKNKFKRLVTV